MSTTKLTFGIKGDFNLDFSQVIKSQIYSLAITEHTKHKLPFGFTCKSDICQKVRVYFKNMFEFHKSISI